ncbi:hypothetical protein BU23DRAFT_592467 [Bimuria novae-zelandiae CBS 107.79]|uniref:ATP adenylyltransferase C-terminal domain-containing protein n=1 Tax=Bimuria novae-zelandiae CBS 107.79 TaxID=1447943 RepID=A0A6A5USV4_9PLEO|nr:hypothetical protein BU23DRAFT_592467 [Bimuria novae-zelandiae CBS 107.79]
MTTMTIRTTIPPKEELVAIFDQLVEEGVILEFRICPVFARKPHHAGAKLDRTFDTSTAAQWGPCSDLYCPDERMKIIQLNGTHDLAFNMFCVDCLQFLLLTLDSYRRKELYVIFNGGEEAGCTRVHKHLQGLRGPPAFENIVDLFLHSTVPFKFFAHRFVGGFHSVTGSQVTEAYLALIAQAKEALDLDQGKARCPHGLFMWKDWMVVIPRRTSGIEGTRASAATAGMLGSVWLSEEGPMEDWVRLGCRDVLKQLGVPQ